MTEIKKDALSAYRQKKIQRAMRGMGIALILPISAIIQNIFNSSVTESVSASITNTALASVIASITIVGIGDLFAGIFAFFFNIAHGKGLKEYKRMLGFPVTRVFLLGALVAGPLATGCWMAATPFCGLTTVAIVTSLAPVLTVFISRFTVKEHISPRATIGVIIVVIGAIAAGWEGFSSGGSNFIIGVILALMAPIGFTLEGQINVFATDMVDPAVSVGTYRTFGAGILSIVIMLVLAVATGNLGAYEVIFSTIFSNPMLILFVALQGLCGCANYMSGMTAFNMTGPSRTLTIDSSRPVWSIPFGFLFAALGIASYSVSTMAVVGSVIVVIGLALVICKPSELVNMRGSD